jgi:hypothetical protein
MQEPNIYAEITRVGLIWLVGALSALGAVFNAEGNLTTRNIIGKVLGGGFAAIAFAAVTVVVFPELKNDTVFTTGMSVFAGYVGLPYIFGALKKLFESRFGKIIEDDKPSDKSNGNSDEKNSEISESDFSQKTRDLFSSSDWTLEELQQMRAEYMRKKQESEDKINRLMDDR